MRILQWKKECPRGIWPWAHWFHAVSSDEALEELCKSDWYHIHSFLRENTDTAETPEQAQEELQHLLELLGAR